MDKKYLNKVLDQLVGETTIDYDKERLYTPFPISLYSKSSFLTSFSSFSYLSPLFPPHFFSKHCEGVYGLNDDEIKYIWNEYKKIIKDKING